MNSIGRAFAIVSIWIATSLAWLVLGGVMTSRSSDATREMASQVEGLWGRPQAQAAPTATLVPLDPTAVEAAPPTVQGATPNSPIPTPPR